MQALSAWAAADCRGVVEAVTGAGKTRLALAAVRAGLSRGGRALVLVPTLDLQEQWVRALAEHVPGARVGRLGGGCDDDLHDHHVVVSTPHSAAPLPIEPPRGDPGLLVADEAHRYGAPTWGDALKPEFVMRLALTATYERSDDGLVEILGPYFGSVVASYDFEDAAADGVIAPFSVAWIAVGLTDTERATYEAADRRVREHRRELLAAGLPRDPRETVRAAAALVARAERREDPEPRVLAARGMLAALRTRRDVAARAEAKLDLLDTLAGPLADHRCLVFTDTVEQAERAAGRLRDAGLATEVLHGRLPGDERGMRLDRFRDRTSRAVVAPRVLDEGLDVPDADVAVVLAAFRTRRQMIQRLGRVLRAKPDGSSARLLVAFARRTREDPRRGAHRGFLAAVEGAAEEIVGRSGDLDPTGARTWLAGATSP